MERFERFAAAPPRTKAMIPIREAIARKIHAVSCPCDGQRFDADDRSMSEADAVLELLRSPEMVKRIAASVPVCWNCGEFGDSTEEGTVVNEKCQTKTAEKVVSEIFGSRAEGE
jgi:hypothetical protein